ncbi:MAG: hypothetical protein KDA69_18215 [Planctomycetaceae bacterium]|nr:hypothetical protein [Planctomycetaceae bacterium]MCA9030478.1 hypothetical protein [Planctomycetaceae bacterium]MCA9046269.1 hypothetical protein [Planctomycetaceae bacterium]MCB9952177.1 hypothetical protein [Planctomycetaceae bacterium]
MHKTLTHTIWTAVIATCLSTPLMAQHIHHDIHDVLRDHVVGRLTSGRQAYNDNIDARARFMVSDFNSQYRGTYCERNGACYYRPSNSNQQVRIEYGSFSHVDDLAARLEYMANELCLDLYYNYSHNRGFDVTYGEAYQILEAARFVHALEHHHMDRQAIRSRIGGLDALFHHVQDDVRGWSRHHHRQVGTLGIIAKMDQMEATLHHLMNDIGVAATAEGEVAPAPGGRELAPPPGAVSARR